MAKIKNTTIDVLRDMAGYAIDGIREEVTHHKALDVSSRLIDLLTLIFDNAQILIEREIKAEKEKSVHHNRH